MLRLATALIVIGACALWACSDDTYVATNETLGGGGGTKSGGGSSGSGGSGGSSDAAWPGGSAGEAGSAGAAAGAAGGGAGGAQGVCTPGEKQDLGSCQKCGTSRRTCDATGQWGQPVCEDQKDCNPGDKTTTGCSDPCAEKTCGASCTFGGCNLKSGATCLYKAGTNFQCCGAGKWQYCNGSSCDWFPCQTCSSCGC